jgi:hypothetical protein
VVLCLALILENLNAEVPQGLPPDLLVTSQVETECVDVVERALHASIDVAFLGLNVSPQDVRNLSLLDFHACFFVLEKEVPTVGRLHVGVDEVALLVNSPLLFLLLFRPILLLCPPGMEVLLDDLFDIRQLLALETL